MTSVIFRTRTDNAIHEVAKALAAAFLHEKGDVAMLREHGVRATGYRWRWIGHMLPSLLREFGTPLDPADYDRIVEWIERFPAFASAFRSGRPRPRIRHYFSFEQRMGKIPTFLRDNTLPLLHSVGDLARWLDLTSEDLDWFADINGWGGRNPCEALRHYCYRWKPKRDGSARLIESPKERLGAIQHQILHGLLEKIPPHHAAHGGVKGCSTLTGAAPHAGASYLIHLDLRDFFTSVNASRVHALFHSLGYSRAISRYLTGLTTHCSPLDVLRKIPIPSDAAVVQRRALQQHARKFLSRHLPQGAPTSPALANLCAWRLDLRLAGAANECSAHYTRYVDDIAFSCKDISRQHAKRISLMLQHIIIDEGFEPNPHKTRILGQAQAQRLTGLIVNVTPNVPRTDYDQLKAILTNCIRQGPASQNRENRNDFRAWLTGRVSYVRYINPARGARLTTLLGHIDWNHSG